MAESFGESRASATPGAPASGRWDGETAPWLASLAAHLGMVVLLATCTFALPHRLDDVDLSLAPADLTEADPLPEEFFAAEETAREIGALSQGGDASALATAAEFADRSTVAFAAERLVHDAIRPAAELAVESFQGPELSALLPVQGAGSVGALGAAGAVDRLTLEIVEALEQGPVLVVWLFDQSGSLRGERAALVDRLRRIYQELGVLEAAGNPAFARHDDKPLLTSVMGFGEEVRAYLPQPTDDYDEIAAAIEAIDPDETGREHVFQAVAAAADRFRTYRLPRHRRRHVMVVVFTDEAGDDWQTLDDTVALCRKLAMPVYVVGRPAPFGREDAYVKWVDPDPQFDQRPQWVPVRLGPETLLPEHLKLRFAGQAADDELLDSGFGPYALTRLCYETGGLYFAAHPNRRVGQQVAAHEVDHLSAHFAQFFDPAVMRRYQPDYVPVAAYQRMVAGNRAQSALIEAAQATWTSPLEDVRTRFPKRDEASLAQDLSLAQRGAAALQPKIDLVCRILLEGEPDRPRLDAPRWQAGYDLALGRALAVQVRTAGYNALLAEAKQGRPFRREGNNTWVLRPDASYASTALERTARKAATALERVVAEHPRTPWAVLAARELATPLGWRWDEDYTPLEPLPEEGAAGRPRPPQPSAMEQGPPRRSPPPL